jgi:hypothetical protein
MALSQAAALVEKAIGHKTNAEIEQDITNPGRDRAKYADPSGETMKALCWMGKNTVQLCMFAPKSQRRASNFWAFLTVYDTNQIIKWKSPSQEWSRIEMWFLKLQAVRSAVVICICFMAQSLKWRREIS